jgi:hypothetical protein
MSKRPPVEVIVLVLLLLRLNLASRLDYRLIFGQGLYYRFANVTMRAKTWESVFDVRAGYMCVHIWTLYAPGLRTHGAKAVIIASTLRRFRRRCARRGSL